MPVLPVLFLKQQICKRKYFFDVLAAYSNFVGGELHSGFIMSFLKFLLRLFF